jgi:hypothetical protein
MGRDYNENVFSVNIPSILHGVLVDAGSLWIKEQPFISSCFKPLEEPVVFMKELAVFWTVICFFKILRTMVCDF